MKFERIGNIADIIAGQSPPSSSYNKNGTGVPFFQGKADYGLINPTIRSWCSEPNKISLPGDILISVRAPVGPVNINNVEACIGRGLSAIRVKDNISRDYVYFYLKINEGKISKLGVGSTFNAITQKDLKEIIIPLPNYSSQQYIANVLTKTENLISQRKESISLLDEFLKSTFLEMFGDPVRNEKGWEIYRLGNICGVGSSKRVFVEELVDSGIPFYRGTEVGHIAEGQEITPSLFITEEHYSQLRKHTGVPKTGDLLMPSICSDGRIFRVINNQPFYFKDGRVLWIKVNESKINSIYLQSILKVIFRTNYHNIASGTTFAELKIVALKQIKIPIAPYVLQTQFAKIVEKTETLKAQYKQGLQDMENLYGSLSQSAFKGELSFKEEGLMTAAEPDVTYTGSLMENLSE